MATAWQAGDRVVVRSARWRVAHVARFADCDALDLTSEHSPAGRTLLAPFDRPRPSSPRRLAVVSRRRWAHEVRSVIQSCHPFGSLRYCPPAIRLLSYQLEPALAMLRHGALRILIADDVGLGKTVEGALVVREVAMADRLSRVLIVLPASLRGQWARELSERFSLTVHDADQDWLRRAGRTLPADVNPWSVPGVYLASMDFVKRPEALRALEDVRWDLMVVDEAHAATPGSHRRDALHALACRARRLLLLTATPHSGSEAQFEAVCGLGAGPHAPPIALFHRRRSDVALEALPVRSCVLPVRPTDRERRMHRRLEAYTARVWTESASRGDERGALIATTLRKRALSSARALAMSLGRRLQLLDIGRGSGVQMRLPLDGSDPLAADDLPDATLSGIGLDDEREEREVVGALVAFAEEAAERESKICALLRLVRRAREPALIFSEYRDTAERIRLTLEGAGYRALGLHGGMAAIARARTIAEFNDGGCLLVATDAASEGLNLQRSCRLVVHFELPWTPVRLQQRTGRVNRIGQTRRVHEIALVGRHTSEQLVLVPLVRRATRAEEFAHMGLPGQIAESRVASVVLGGVTMDESTAPRDRARTITMNLSAEGAAEAARIQLLRRLAQTQALSTRPPRGARAIVPLTHGPGPPGCHSVTVVLALLLRDRRELVVEQSLFALTFDVSGRAWERRAPALRSQVRRALELLDPHIAEAARAEIRNRLAHIEPLRLRASEALRIRDRELRLVRRSTAQLLVQAGLFDRRAMRVLAWRVRAGEVLDDEEGAAGGEDEACRGGGSGEIEIRAVLVGGRS